MSMMQSEGGGPKLQDLYLEVLGVIQVMVLAWLGSGTLMI